MPDPIPPDNSAGCQHPADAVKWNPWNHVTQCHACGETMPSVIPADHPAVEAACAAMYGIYWPDPARLNLRVARTNMAAALTAARPLLPSSEHLHEALAEMTIAYAKAMMAMERYGQHIKPCAPTYAGVDCICGLYITLRDLGAE